MSARWDRSDITGRDRDPAVRSRGARGEARDPNPRSLQERLDGTLLDVAVHRAVAYSDIVQHHFGGHPYAARRGVDRLVRAGYLVQSRAPGPKGGTFLVLHATHRGADQARSLAARGGLDPDQRAWSGIGRKADLVHDVAIYRAVQVHRAQLLDAGARVTRIRLDAELRGIVARRSEAARVRAGKQAADAARREAARALGLPVLDDGRVLYPDGQVEYLDPEGNVSRVSIEIATEHYKPEAVASKAGAGFAVHAANGRAGRTVLAGLAALAGLAGKAATGSGGGGGRGRTDDPGSVEL